MRTPILLPWCTHCQCRPATTKTQGDESYCGKCHCLVRVLDPQMIRAFQKRESRDLTESLKESLAAEYDRAFTDTEVVHLALRAAEGILRQGGSLL